MSELPVAVQRYIGALVLIAVGAMVVEGAFTPAPAWEHWLRGLPLFGLVTLAQLFPINFGYKQKVHLDQGVLFAAVLWLDPVVAMAVAGGGTLLAHAVHPDSRDLPQALFNTAQAVLLSSGAALVLWLAGSAGGRGVPTDAGQVTAAVLAAAFMFGFNILAVTTVIGLQAGTVPLSVWYRSALVSDLKAAVPHLAQYGIGLLAVVVIEDRPWAAVLLVLPAVAVYRALTLHVEGRRVTEESLRGVEASLAEAQRVAQLGSLTWDLATGNQLWSDETFRVFGFEPQSFPASYDIFLASVLPADRERVEQAIGDALAGRTAYSLDHRIVQASGAERTVHDRGEVVSDERGVAVRVVGTVHDVTERKQLEAQLSHRAFHDPLTELPNRAQFNDRLDRALGDPRRRGDPVAVLFMDLDGFKQVNDQLGHEAGDHLLVAVADRLRAGIRPGDTAARLGGDEFTVLLDPMPNPREAVAISERLIVAIRQPYRIGGDTIAVSSSVGIAWGTIGQTRSLDLLRDADAALYEAKSTGKDRCVVFEPRMSAEVVQRATLQNELRGVVERDELRLLYQPQVNLHTGAVVGFEALVRWQHPVHGLISPDAFVPLAEETGAIVPIGWWVLDEACRQVARWTRRHPEAASVAIGVNLSVRQLLADDFVDRVDAVLGESGLAAGRLRLEITEHILGQDHRAPAKALRTIRTRGVRVALDKFGSGQSSLTSLREWPVDTLKLAPSFGHGLAGDARSAAIVEAVGNLAAKLGMDVVAEGIETADQMVRVRVLGCDVGQGFFFAPPLPSAEVGAFLTGGGTYDVLRDALSAAGHHGVGVGA